MNVLLNRYCWEGLILLLVRSVQAEPPEDPIYVKTSNGWNAAYAHGSEYEFRVMGNGTKSLKFDDARNWKIVKMHRLTKKELAEEQ